MHSKRVFGGVLPAIKLQKLGAEKIKVKLLLHTFVTSHHNQIWAIFRAHYQLFLTYSPKGCFYPLEGTKIMKWALNCPEIKVLVNKLLTKPSYVKFGSFWTRYKLFHISTLTGGGLGGGNWGAIKKLLKCQTTCLRVSKKQSYNKCGLFFNTLLSFFLFLVWGIFMVSHLQVAQ